MRHNTGCGGRCSCWWGAGPEAGCEAKNGSSWWREDVARKAWDSGEVGVVHKPSAFVDFPGELRVEVGVEPRVTIVVCSEASSVFLAHCLLVGSADPSWDQGWVSIFRWYLCGVEGVEGAVLGLTCLRHGFLCR